MLQERQQPSVQSLLFRPPTKTRKHQRTAQKILLKPKYCCATAVGCARGSHLLQIEGVEVQARRARGEQRVANLCAVLYAERLDRFLVSLERSGGGGGVIGK